MSDTSPPSAGTPEPLPPQDTQYTRNPVCPYCGYKMRNAWEDVAESDGWELAECGGCEQEYLVTRNVSVTYSTRFPNATS